MKKIYWTSLDKQASIEMGTTDQYPDMTEDQIRESVYIQLIKQATSKQDKINIFLGFVEISEEN